MSGLENDSRVRRVGLDLEVDLHGMRAAAAKSYLQRLLLRAAQDRDAAQLTVIHGFHSGTALRDMVRNELCSPAIRSIHPGMTAGKTVIVLEKSNSRKNQGASGASRRRSR